MPAQHSLVQLDPPVRQHNELGSCIRCCSWCVCRRRCRSCAGIRTQAQRKSGELIFDGRLENSLDKHYEGLRELLNYY